MILTRKTMVDWHCEYDLQGIVKQFLSTALISNSMIFMGFLLGACVGNKISLETNPIVSEKAPIPISKTSSDPVKVVETPWGSRELHDPAQDPEFIKKLYEIYTRGDVTFGDIAIHGLSSEELNEPDDVRYVREALQAHHFDLARLGCKTSDYFSRRGHFHERGLSVPCPDTLMGNPVLSACEIQKWVVTVTTPEIISMPVKRTDRPRYRLEDAHIIPSQNEPGTVFAQFEIWRGLLHENSIHPISFIGEVSAYSQDETLEFVTYAQCEEWHKPYWINQWHEGNWYDPK